MKSLHVELTGCRSEAGWVFLRRTWPLSRTGAPKYSTAGNYWHSSACAYQAVSLVREGKQQFCKDESLLFQF